jgi:hypothetical protein
MIVTWRPVAVELLCNISSVSDDGEGNTVTIFLVIFQK